MKAKILLPYYDFKHNLKSSITIYLVVTLCVILSIASLLSIKSFITYRESLNDINNNSYDLIFLDTKFEDYLKLIEYDDNNINTILYAHNIGYAKLSENIINNKKYMLIEEMIPDGFSNEGFNLISGKIPISDNELLIPLEYSKIYDVKIGDIITYDIGNITSDDNEYYRLKSYDDSFENYKFKKEVDKEYTIVGIYNKSNSTYIDNTDLSHYYAYTYMNKRILNNEDLVDVSISLYDKNRLNKDLENYKLFLKPTENSLIILTNGTKTYDVSFKNKTYLIVGLLLIVIVTLAIKSSFNFESKKRREFYAEEMCLGATVKNIKESWYYLTYFLTIIGIISGVFFSNLLLHYFIKVLVNKEKIDIILTEMFSKGIILYAALIILIAIIISYALSEKKVLYVTALDYLKNKYEPIDPKYVHYDEYTELKGEISKYIKSNFVLNHIKDNKLMFSLPFMVAFLLLFISFVFIITKPIVDFVGSKDINITISINDFESHIDSLNNISKISGVKDYLIIGNSEEVLYLKNEYENSDNYTFLKVIDDYYNYPVNLIVIEDIKYDSLVKKDSDIVLIPIFNILKNEEIMSSKLFEEDEHKELTIYSSNNEYLLSDVLVSSIDSNLLQIKSGYINIIVKQSKLNEFFDDLSVKYNKVNMIIGDHIFIDKLDEYVKNNKIDIDLTYNVDSLIYNPNSNYIVLSYYLGLLVGSISLLLFCIIVYTSLNTYVKDREKEIALLRVVGISSKNINQIVNGEFGDAYFITVLVGIMIGAALAKVFCNVYLIDELNSVDASMNLLFFYLVLFMVMIIVFFIALIFSTRRLRRKSPMEFLKENYREY